MNPRLASVRQTRFASVDHEDLATVGRLEGVEHSSPGRTQVRVHARVEYSNAAVGEAHRHAAEVGSLWATGSTFRGRRRDLERSPDVEYRTVDFPLAGRAEVRVAPHRRQVLAHPVAFHKQE